MKEKLQNNQLSIGSWITLGHFSIAEIMANAGFDWLCIDMEHTVIDYLDAQRIIMAIQGKRKLAYVRVGENNVRIIKRVLDAGADGVIVPMINSEADAIKAVDAVRYPPVGKRGVGLARAQEYGFTFEEYIEKQKKIKLIIQIEHISAISNLSKILSVDGIDGSIIGPYDLSASLGKPGRYEEDDVIEALKEYEQISSKVGKPMGFHIVEPNYKKLLDMWSINYSILALSFDAMFLGTICRDQIKKIKENII